MYCLAFKLSFKIHREKTASLPLTPEREDNMHPLKFLIEGG